MSFQSVPDTVQASLVFQMDGIPAVNTLTFKKTGGYSQTDLDDLAAAIDGWIDSDYVGRMSTNTTYIQTNVKGLESQIDLQATNATNTGQTGGLSLAQANNVTKAFTLRSGFTGRSARGRMFAIGLSSNQMDDTNTVKSTFVDDFVSILEALKVIIEALGWVWVVVSRYTNGAPRVTGITTPITSLV